MREDPEQQQLFWSRAAIKPFLNLRPHCYKHSWSQRQTATSYALLRQDSILLLYLLLVSRLLVFHRPGALGLPRNIRMFITSCSPSVFGDRLLSFVPWEPLTTENQQRGWCWASCFLWSSLGASAVIPLDMSQSDRGPCGLPCCMRGGWLSHPLSFQMCLSHLAQAWQC